MASRRWTWRQFIILISLLLRDAVVESSELAVNATSVHVGFLWENPRVENHNTNEVVLDKPHMQSTLRLLCFITPPLSRELEYEKEKDKIVKWEKVTYIHETADSMRYWSNDRSMTAISYGNVNFNVIGTYSCSYGGLSGSINVKVQNADIVKALRPPSNFTEVHKYVTHMKELTSIPGWNPDSVLSQDVGTSTFSCQVGASASKPSSVHLLRPSDVNLVGALGGADTTGLGARATSWNGFFTEYKESSWSIGGGGKLNHSITLPNLLKEFNPNLKGFSTSKDSWSLNAASVTASSGELERQVDTLVKRMQESQTVDFDNDWKVVTVSVGSHDLCHICKDETRFSPSNMIKYTMHALSSLKKKTKRVFVNLVLPMDVSVLHTLYSAKPHCKILGWSACPCVASGDQADRSKVSSAAAQYKKLLIELIDTGVYDVSDTFTVVLQPFMYNGPRNQAGELVGDVFGPDCLHLNSKGHASAATALWNNMLESHGRKSTVWLPDAPLKCPTQDNPYLRTKTNSHIVVGMEIEADDTFLGMPPAAAVAIAVVLVAVVIGVSAFVWRSRRSRPHKETIRLMTTHYRRPTIYNGRL